MNLGFEAVVFNLFKFANRQNTMKVWWESVW